MNRLAPAGRLHACVTVFSSGHEREFASARLHDRWLQQAHIQRHCYCHLHAAMQQCESHSPDCRRCPRARPSQFRQEWFDTARADQPPPSAPTRLQRHQTGSKHYMYKKNGRLLCDLTSRHVVDREEALPSVLQLSHPPVVVVVPQHLDDVILHEGHLVRPLRVVVVQRRHLPQ